MTSNAHLDCGDSYDHVGIHCNFHCATQFWMFINLSTRTSAIHDLNGESRTTLLNMSPANSSIRWTWKLQVALLGRFDVHAPPAA